MSNDPANARGYSKHDPTECQGQKEKIFTDDYKSRNLSKVTYADPQNGVYGLKSKPSIKNVIFQSKLDATIVMNELIEIADAYGWATLSDFYDLSGISYGNHHYRDIGWNLHMIKNSVIRRCTYGYYIDLPMARANVRQAGDDNG